MRKRTQILSGWLPIVAALLFLSLQAHARPQNAFTILVSFDAVAGDPGRTYKDHPDMALAACSNSGKAGQVLVATGQDVVVYDSTGHALKSESTREFIQAAGGDPRQVNDPRATYDPFIRRWIVACTCPVDFLMVSAGEDATGPWKGIALTGAEGDLTMFPGWDRNGIYVSEFEYPLNSREIALPTDDVAWKGEANISLAHRAVFNGRPYEMRPAVDSNPTKGAGEPEYLAARTGPPQRATNFPMDLLVDRITWTGKTATVSGPSSIPTGFLYNTPTAAAQPSGQAIRGNESHRIFSVSAQDGHLYVVESSGPCTSGCGDQGADANNLFYWFDIVTPAITLRQKAKVSDPSLSLLFPTLAVDGRGNVGIGVTGTSGTQNPSVYLYTHLARDPPGKTNGPFLAHQGAQSYSCDKNPPSSSTAVGWGTYSATVRDGSDPLKLWTIQEYGGSAAPCVWKTRVIAFRLASP